MRSPRHRALPTVTPRWAIAAAAGLAVAATVGLVVVPHPTSERAAASGVPRSVTSLVHQQAPAPVVPATDTTLPTLAATPGPVGQSATSPPTSVVVPSLGISSGLESLGLLGDGTLQSPTTYGEAGWFTGGTRPGDVGPAVIIGHIDSYQGPGVFYRLASITPGAAVAVTRADGSTLTFVVESVAQYPKAQFPTDLVYGPTPTPELRLITCTGAFDRTARSYLDNLVVRAVLTASTAATQP